MKKGITDIFLLSAVIAGLELMVPGGVMAQIFTPLYSFTNGNDGANPYGVPYGLVLSDDTLYGTATLGGSSGNGTVFAVHTNGRGFTNLHSFKATNRVGINSDGSEPNALIISGDAMYGTATFGGSWANGTVFAVHTNGTAFTNLHSFTATDPTTGINSDGAHPFAGLILSGSTLYGTATFGGNSSNGTVFAVNTNGTGFTNLHSFTTLSAPPPDGTNNDGAQPYAGLMLSGNTLYGAAAYGGSSGNGTVFAINTNGTGFTNLYTFTALDVTETTNRDGAYPNGLILAGKTLFGTANSGGSSGSGTVFAINTNGTGFTNLHSFTATDPTTGINSDGAYPVVGLILSGNTLYGTAPYGGSTGNGTVFAVNANGRGFTNLHSFTAINSNTGINNDGANPQAGVICSGNTLYGTAYNGGSSGYGTVFSLLLPSVSAPQLSIMSLGTNVILMWPTNAGGFSLQSAASLLPPISWGAVSPLPTTINGMNTVTNPAFGTAKFYSLGE